MDPIHLTGLEIGRNAPDQGGEIDTAFPQLSPSAIKFGKVQHFIDQEEEPGRIPYAGLEGLSTFVIQ
jgi:hypothetical protein